jgi:hypothetical protein
MRCSEARAAVMRDILKGLPRVDEVPVEELLRLHRRMTRTNGPKMDLETIVKRSRRRS